MLANRAGTTRIFLEFFDEDTTLTSHGILRGMVQTKDCRGSVRPSWEICEGCEVHKASLSWPSSSCVPPTPTTGCRNSPGASSTSSWRRSRRACLPPRAASAAGGVAMACVVCVAVRSTRHNGAPLLVLRRHSASAFHPAHCPMGTTVRKGCVLRTSLRVPMPTGSKTIGSITNTTQKRALTQLTLHSANCVPFPRHWKSSA